jgi:hypothetical protein
VAVVTEHSLRHQADTLWLRREGVEGTVGCLEPLGVHDLPRRFHSIFRDKNRRDIGKSQSKWTAHKMETPPCTFFRIRYPRVSKNQRSLVLISGDTEQTSRAGRWCQLGQQRVVRSAGRVSDLFADLTGCALENGGWL